MINHKLIEESRVSPIPLNEVSKTLSDETESLIFNKNIKESTEQVKSNKGLLIAKYEDRTITANNLDVDEFKSSNNSLMQ